MTSFCSSCVAVVIATVGINILARFTDVIEQKSQHNSLGEEVVPLL